MPIINTDDIVGNIKHANGAVIMDNGVYYNGHQIAMLCETVSNGWVMEMFEPYLINSVTMQVVNARLIRLNREWADGDEKKLAILGMNR